MKSFNALAPGLLPLGWDRDGIASSRSSYEQVPHIPASVLLREATKGFGFICIEGADDAFRSALKVGYSPVYPQALSVDSGCKPKLRFSSTPRAA